MRKKTIILLIFLSINFYSFLFFESLSHKPFHSINIINECSTNLRSSDTNNKTVNTQFNARDYLDLYDNGIELTGKGISIAIIDSGIEPDHIVFTNDGENDWREKILAFYDVDTGGINDSPYDDSGHGTNIASILTGYCRIYHGVAPETNLIILKLPESDDGEGFEYTSSEFEDAIDWIIDNKDLFNIRIVSISFGQYISSGRIDAINDLNKKAEKLIDEDILVVAGAGNEGKKGQGSIGSPGSAKAVLAVGGVDEEGKICDFSSRGPSHEGTTKPDVCSVAEDVYMAQVSDSDDEFGHDSGTSFATPLVAGLAALLLEVDNELSPQELKNIISLTSFRTSDPQVTKDNNQGWGVVQGYAALDALKEQMKIKQDSEIEISFDEYYNVFCQPIKLEPGHYFFELEQKDSAKAEIFLFDSEPDEYGEPILISHSINIFSNDNPIKRMGAYIPEKHDYYLVVKLVDDNEKGAFTIRLVIEYRLTFLLILAALNIVALIYEIRMLLRFKKRNQTLRSVKKKKKALIKIFLLVDTILTLLTISCYIILANVIVGLFFVIFIISISICGISLLISLKSLISIRKKNKLTLYRVSDY